MQGCGKTDSSRYLYDEQVCNGCYLKALNAGQKEELKAAFVGKAATEIFKF